LLRCCSLAGGRLLRDSLLRGRLGPGGGFRLLGGLGRLGGLLRCLLHCHLTGLPLDSLGRESAVLYPAPAAAATAPELFPQGRDRSPAHPPAARLQALRQPAAGTALPVRAHLLGIRHAGHLLPRGAEGKLAGPAPDRPLPPAASRRP